MTKEDILAMEVGRELSGLVAVMDMGTLPPHNHYSSLADSFRSLLTIAAAIPNQIGLLSLFG